MKPWYKSNRNRIALLTLLIGIADLVSGSELLPEWARSAALAVSGALVILARQWGAKK